MKKKLLLLLVICLAAAALTIGAAADGDDLSDIPEEYRVPISLGYKLTDATDDNGTKWTILSRNSSPATYDVLVINGNGVITEIPTEIREHCDDIRFIFIENCSVGDSPNSQLFRSFSRLELLWIGCTESSNVSKISIGRSAFSSMDNLKYVYIGKGVTSIGDYAFENCDNLKRVIFHNGASDLTSIGDSAFNSCTSLTSFDFPDSLTYIGGWAFQSSGLTEVNIPNSVTELGELAFAECGNLTKVTIGNGLSAISAGAFSKCENLEYVYIPGTVQTIKLLSFAWCPKIETLIIEDGVKLIENHAFSCAPQIYDSLVGPSNTSLKTLIIPDSVEEIWNHAFYGMEALEELTIGNGITRIASDCFYNCFSLEELKLGNKVEYIDARAFANCHSLTQLVLPDTLKEIGQEAFYGGENILVINFNDGLRVIGDSAFSGCRSITEADLPDTVMSLGTRAFYNCTNLRHVELSTKMTAIVESTFQNCSALQSLTIPDAITSIGANAFNGCTALTTVTTNNFINSVGGAAFDGCDDLTLYGYDRSYMQAYAAAYDIPFVVIGGDTVNSIESVTSAPGFDEGGKPCTVVTITMTNGDVEKFYIYDGEDGKDGQDGEDGEDGEIVIVPSFSDVSADSYYSDAVNWAVANGITTGTGNGEFSPDDGCSRAQVVTFLWRAMGCPEPTGSSSFNDVPADSYYGKAAQWALENGITTGVGGNSFGSNSTVTRAEVVTFLWRAAGSPEVSGSGFADVDSSAYYADAVAWAVANGITTGTGESTFSPDSSCTRAQIVTFLYRYFN